MKHSNTSMSQTLRKSSRWCLQQSITWWEGNARTHVLIRTATAAAHQSATLSPSKSHHYLWANSYASWLLNLSSNPLQDDHYVFWFRKSSRWCLQQSIARWEGNARTYDLTHCYRSSPPISTLMKPPPTCAWCESIMFAAIHCMMRMKRTHFVSLVDYMSAQQCIAWWEWNARTHDLIHWHG